MIAPTAASNFISLYTIFFQFIALRRIDAAAFTVCAQLKILTTAFFSVGSPLALCVHLVFFDQMHNFPFPPIIAPVFLAAGCAMNDQVMVLNRSISMTKWRALMLIVCASILVSTPSLSDPSCDPLSPPSTSSSLRTADASQDDAGIPGEGEGDGSTGSSVETMMGFAAVLLEVTLSGFGNDFTIAFIVCSLHAIS